MTAQCISHSSGTRGSSGSHFFLIGQKRKSSNNIRIIQKFEGLDSEPGQYFSVNSSLAKENYVVKPNINEAGKYTSLMELQKKTG